MLINCLSLIAVLGDAIVKFNYDKSQDDELNLKIGDVVKDVVQVSLKLYSD